MLRRRSKACKKKDLEAILSNIIWNLEIKNKILTNRLLTVLRTTKLPLQKTSSAIYYLKSDLLSRWYNDDAYVIVINFGRTYQVVNLTAFDLIFGQLEVEASSVFSSRTYRLEGTYYIAKYDEISKRFT